MRREGEPKFPRLDGSALGARQRQSGICSLAPEKRSDAANGGIVEIDLVPDLIAADENRLAIEYSVVMRARYDDPSPPMLVKGDRLAVIALFLVAHRFLRGIGDVQNA